MEEFMDYRQVHERIQKPLGKDIPSNLPNRINLEEEKQGAEWRMLQAPVLTLAESSTSTAGETASGEINCLDLFLMYLKITKKAQEQQSVVLIWSP